MTSFVLSLIPLVTGYAASWLFPMRRTPATRIRPPSPVFGVVWPILYVACGVSWATAHNRAATTTLVDAVFGLICTLLVAWFPIQQIPDDAGLMGRLAVLVILIATSMAASLVCVASADSLEAALLVVPLNGWCVFATILTAVEAVAHTTPTNINTVAVETSPLDHLHL